MHVCTALCVFSDITFKSVLDKEIKLKLILKYELTKCMYSSVCFCMSRLLNENTNSSYILYLCD